MAVTVPACHAGLWRHGWQRLALGIPGHPAPGICSYVAGGPRLGACVAELQRRGARAAAHDPEVVRCGARRARPACVQGAAVSAPRAWCNAVVHVPTGLQRDPPEPGCATGNSLCSARWGERATRKAFNAAEPLQPTKACGGHASLKRKTRSTRVGRAHRHRAAGRAVRRPARWVRCPPGANRRAAQTCRALGWPPLHAWPPLHLGLALTRSWMVGMHQLSA